MGSQKAERLSADGFSLTEGKEDSFRLLGKDDDTEWPLVAHILQSTCLTIVVRFERKLKRRLHMKPLSLFGFTVLAGIPTQRGNPG